MAFICIIISVQGCNCARSEPRNAPPCHDLELRPRFLLDKLWPPTFPSFSPYVHFLVVANHNLTFIRKKWFFSQLFSRDYFRFFPTPREPFFFHSLFLSPTFSWKLCQVLLANGFVLFCLYFTGISTSVPHVLTLTDLCNFQYSQGVIFVLGLPLLRRFSISPRY